MIRDVSLREMLVAMSAQDDCATFRWFQASVVNAQGVPEATETLRVSMGQVRREVFAGQSTADARETVRP